MLKFDLTVNKKPRCDFSLRGIRMTLFTIVVILHYCGNRHSAPLSKIVEGEADAKVKSCAVDNLFHFFINKFFIFQSYRQWRITLHPLDANRPNSVLTGSGASRCIHWMQTDQILSQPAGTYRCRSYLRRFSAGNLPANQRTPS